MTQAKAMTRKRRTGSAIQIPKVLAAWFAGEPRPATASAVPWIALTYPDYLLLPDRWAAWKAENPGARPPAGWEDRCEPKAEPTGHRLELLEAARAKYGGR